MISKTLLEMGLSFSLFKLLNYVEAGVLTSLF